MRQIEWFYILPLFLGDSGNEFAVDWNVDWLGKHIAGSNGLRVWVLISYVWSEDASTVRLWITINEDCRPQS